MLDDFLSPPSDNVLGVTALTRQIKTLLQGSFRQVWVQGEISNLRKQSSGHVYFSLKDEKAQLPCVLFARDATCQSFELRDGMKVQLLGDISVYEPHGSYQLIAKIALENGIGQRQFEFERLKRKLAAEGLFDSERKQDLPPLPLRIAVVTSPTGAAIHDFLQILKRRKYCGEVVIFPARVQGEKAAEEMECMLKQAARSTPGFDLVVITRGGGSIEDLWAFNEESLARAVAACPLPMISAVGHEIDTVLTDYAADARAETPSGAAELISSLYLNTAERFKTARKNLFLSVESCVTNQQQFLKNLKARMRIIAPVRQIEHCDMHLDDLENRLRYSLKDKLSNEQNQINHYTTRLKEHHPKIRINLIQQSIATTKKRLQQSTLQSIKQHTGHLEQLRKRLENNSLNATLSRGYAILKRADGEILTSVKTTSKNKEITAQFHDGEIDLEVRETKK